MIRTDISGHTKLICLLGSPVGHSLSPLMHNTAFQQLGLDYAYLCFDVDENGLETAVAGLMRLGVRGFNLTMPDKNAVVPLCDSLSPAARLIGAVNTVVNDRGILTGHNTDGVGFWRSALDYGFRPAGRKCVILGAGGAASAIAVQGALDKLAELKIFARKSSRFHERTLKILDGITRETSCKAGLFDLEEKEQLQDAVASADILINATPVGMEPDTDHSLIQDTSCFRPDLTVADVIYHPQKTLLLAQAKQAGCNIFNGMDMLLYQGAEAFRLWTGQDMPVDSVRKVLDFSR